MKKLTLITALSVLSTGTFAAELKTDEEKLAYTIGSQVGESLLAVNEVIPLNEKILFEAISDVLKNKKPQLSKAEMERVLETSQKKAAEKMQAKIAAESKANKAEGEKYLAANKAKDGVKVTASGLQYRVIKAGDGKKPVSSDTVKVNYKGFLTDGTKFDDSSDAGGPVEFPLTAVIPGWTEGLQLMPVGSTYELVIPAKLAYGEMAPPAIGPNRVLRFEVELVAIKAKQPIDKKVKPAEKSVKKAVKKSIDKAEKKAEDKTKEVKAKAVKKEAS